LGDKKGIWLVKKTSASKPLGIPSAVGIVYSVSKPRLATSRKVKEIEISDCPMRTRKVRMTEY